MQLSGSIFLKHEFITGLCGNADVQWPQIWVHFSVSAARYYRVRPAACTH